MRIIRSSLIEEEGILQRSLSASPVFIKGVEYNWLQGELPHVMSLKEREWGFSITCSEDQNYIVAVEMLMQNYLYHKDINFPGWSGNPRFIVGPTMLVPYLVRTDGTDIEKSVQEAWDTFKGDRSSWEESNPGDSYPLEYTLPEGYKFEYKKWRLFGWHAIV